MKTKINLLAVIIVLSCVINSFSSMAMAQEETKSSMRGQTEAKAVNAGNKICPVTGGKVGDMGKAAHYEYKGT